MKKTVVELFAGVGGFRVGLNDIKSFDKDGKALENRDWQFVWANQWEPSTKAQPAYECYKTHFGDKEISNEDIHKVVTENIKSIPKHTLLVGGFPCQDYSVARSLSGEKGIEGKKGVLFWDIAEILEHKKPPFVLLENVDRLLKSPAKQRGRDFGIMLRTFNDKGYNVEWRIINSAEYGARQKRRRIFIFAWNKKTKYNKKINKFEKHNIMHEEGLFAKSFPIEKESHKAKEVNLSEKEYKDTVDMTNEFSFLFENTGCMIDGVVATESTIPHEKKPIKLKSILLNSVDASFNLNEKQIEKFVYLKGAKKEPRTRPNGVPYFYSEGACAFPDHLDQPGRTMLTSEGTVNRSTHVVTDLKNGKLRFITPVEAERLQHFPDDWTNTGMTKRQRYFMMGNALVTYIISKIEPTLESIISKE